MVELRPATTRPGAAAAAVALALAVGQAGCGEVRAVPVDPSTRTGVFVEVRFRPPVRVDLLFVVGDSSSMAEAQGLLASNGATLIRDLVAPEAAEWGQRVGLDDLHVGIVTSDLGECGGLAEGGGGALRRGGGACAAQPTPWLSHSTDAPDDGSDETDAPIWEDFRCAATVGTSGCEVQQPLEAALRALTVQARPGGPNEGFLRDDSYLAIVFVTDVDDCSVRDPAFFDESRDDLGPAAARCVRHEELLHPVSRYYDGLMALRPERYPIEVSAVAGVPVDGSWAPGDPLDALRALRRFDPDDPDSLLPSCETEAGRGLPPVRIAELVSMFREGVLESVCRPEWAFGLRTITSVTYRWDEPCMARELATTDASDCRVVETLTDDGPCPHLARWADGVRVEGWHVDLGVDEDGRRECEILAADIDGDGCPDGPCDCEAGVHDGCLEGWFFRRDEELCGHGRVELTTAELPDWSSVVRFECGHALCPERRRCVQALEAAAPCEPGAADGCPRDQVCVRHADEQLCGGAPSCGRCSPTVEAVCPATEEDRWRSDPLVEAGACCHEGFHCEPTTRACIADRWLVCE